MIEKGLISFIKQKLDQSVDELSIKHTLVRAGFPLDRIDAAILFVKKTDTEAHQKVAEQNDFLPPLKKEGHVEHNQVAKASSYSDSPQKGLFRGRLLRRDFILGFLFFFGLGYITLVVAGVFLYTTFPELWASLISASLSDEQGLLKLVIPLILLPITVMVFSLITRRLHNLGLPGGLSLVFFGLCLSPAGPINFYGIWILYAVMLILFILLVTKKGNMAPNEYGPYPSHKGSFFRRIFNL